MFIDIFQTFPYSTAMQFRLPTLFALCALTLLGCSSTGSKTKAKVDTGPIAAATFNFLEPGTRPAADFAEKREPVHALIQEAITKHLATKGLTRVNAGGDITVQYLIIISDGVSTRAINDHFGYPAQAYDLQEKAHEAFTEKDKNPTPYNAGTLVIDLVDSKSFKLLKRGYAWRPILREVPLSTRQSRLQEAVAEALKGLRVTQ